MRYRPLGNNGTAVSALSIVMPDEAPVRGETTRLIYAALEAGINFFEFAAHSDPAMLREACQALGAVERDLVIVGLRLTHGRGERSLSTGSLQQALQTMLGEGKLGRLDIISLEAPHPGETALPVFQALEKLRDARRLRYIGLSGDGESLDGHIDSGRFDVLHMPFSIASGWVERNRVKRAVAKDMIVAASEFVPANLPAKPEGGATRGLKRLIGKAPDPVYQAYEFLYRSPDWTAEQICLAYALTEPSLATIQVRVGKADQIAPLASIPDREMPNGVPALIEMARFSLAPEAKRA